MRLKRMKPLSAVWLPLAATVALAAGFAPPNSNAMPVQAQTAPTVGMLNSTFAPRTITITAGDTVTWLNNEDPSQPNTDHDIVALDGVTISSPILAGGDAYSLTFSTPGTYEYICDLHTNMDGVVVVQ